MKLKNISITLTLVLFLSFIGITTLSAYAVEVVEVPVMDEPIIHAETVEADTSTLDNIVPFQNHKDTGISKGAPVIVGSKNNSQIEENNKILNKDKHENNVMIDMILGGLVMALLCGATIMTVIFKDFKK